MVFRTSARRALKIMRPLGRVPRSMPVSRPEVRHIVRQALRSDEEMKYALISASYSVTSTSGIYNLANTSQGDTGGEHIGDECRLRDIQLRWHVTCADNLNTVRMIVFVWKPQMAFAGPAAINILKTVTPPFQLTSPYQEDGEDQYRILYDKVVCLGLSAGSPLHVYGKWKRKLNIKQDYQTSSSNCSNNIYILLVSDSAAVVDPTIDFVTRIGFTDA